VVDDLPVHEARHDLVDGEREAGTDFVEL